MQNFLQDLRYGARMLMRSPGFTAVAVLTLALGIGANTAIFSVVNTVLLKPLPFEDSDQLVQVYEAYPEQGFWHGWHSAPLYYDWRERNEVFSQISPIWQRGYVLTGSGEAASISATSVVSDFFPLFRLKPILGRGFNPEEEVEGRNNVVVISYGFWQERFGGNGEVLNKSITLNGTPHTIIGVMPPGQAYPRRTKLWTPFVVPEESNHRGLKFMYSVARLKSDVTLEQARANMTAVAKSIAEDYPKNFSKEFDTGVFPMKQEIVGRTSKALWLLLGAVSFVLLIACANVANLLLARAASREKELAVRAAIGAGRGRLLRQLLTESVLLSMTGGGLGLLLAWGGVQGFIAFSPGNIPRLSELGVDWEILTYSLLLTFATGLLFGLAPALKSSRPELSSALREGSRTGGGGFSLLRRHRLRNLLVIGEVAMALVLLVGAGLMVRSFTALLSEDTGLKADRVLTVEISLPEYKYSTSDQQRQFFEELLARTASVQSIQQAGVINALPFGGHQWMWSFRVAGSESGGKLVKGGADYRLVTPGYFRAMGIPILRGRSFTAEDRADLPGAFIINEAFAREKLPNREALGSQIRLDDHSPWSTIVGVVGDVRHNGLADKVEPEMYRPFAQAPHSSMTMVFRAEGDVTALTGTIRGFVKDLDPNQPVGRISTMEALISNSVSRPRFYMALLGLFAAVAAALAAVGIYGVMAYSVSQRTHEIGIRVALGAQRSQVLRLVLLQGAILTGVGIVLGITGAVALTRYMASLLHGITATDPLTFVAISFLLSAVSLLASYIPARRATKVDPMVALRYE